MAIQLLDNETINKIAAGEVVERPMAVAKELVENSIDAGANAITVEIKEGGSSLIRITDNGSGINKEEIPLAFRKHSTSKIHSVEDLFDVKSLGFRGEALASVAAVSQMELLTKTAGALTGARYQIEGGKEISLEEVGCPEGSTFLIRNLFYNTPARRKFLKTNATEAAYVLDAVERLAMSHPGISFKFIHNGVQKFQTSGNGSAKDVIYQIYGKDVATNLIDVKEDGDGVRIRGYVGKPVISRGNRNYMNYFVNGRYVKSGVVNRAIEDAYKGYSMSNRYPFTALTLTIDGELVDVNVHPTKMEVRFQHQDELYRMIHRALVNALRGKDLIPNVSFEREDVKEEVETAVKGSPEPFELKRRQEYAETVYQAKVRKEEEGSEEAKEDYVEETPEQYGMDLFGDAPSEQEGDVTLGWRLVGQLFRTYWVYEKEDAMYLLDQHAAHEKILYEEFVSAFQKGAFDSQMLRPPIVVTLSMREEEAFKGNRGLFQQLGFEVEPFGGREYAISGVPAKLSDVAGGEWFLELLDAVLELGRVRTPELVLEKLASLSCKAAVKGNQRYSPEEAQVLLTRLMRLENPFHCPHGRPTMVRMDKKEIEKRFKRV